MGAGGSPTLTGAVTYPAPTVTDNCPGAATVCVPPSGSTFPEGTTAVTCTASDTDDPRVFVNANISWGTRAGTVKLVDRATGRQFVLRDRNILDSVCQ